MPSVIRITFFTIALSLLTTSLAVPAPAGGRAIGASGGETNLPNSNLHTVNLHRRSPVKGAGENAGKPSKAAKAAPVAGAAAPAKKMCKPKAKPAAAGRSRLARRADPPPADKPESSKAKKFISKLNPFKGKKKDTETGPRPFDPESLKDTSVNLLETERREVALKAAEQVKAHKWSAVKEFIRDIETYNAKINHISPNYCAADEETVKFDENTQHYEDRTGQFGTDDEPEIKVMGKWMLLSEFKNYKRPSSSGRVVDLNQEC